MADQGGGGLDQCIDDELRQLLSQILGYVSIGCWIVVGLPQIVENYKLKSGESLSLLFVYIWLAGDLFNTAGSLLNRLPLPMILVNVWYLFMDVVLISQVYYYRAYNARWGRTAWASSSTSSDYVGNPVVSSRDPHAAPKQVPATPVNPEGFVTPQSSPPTGNDHHDDDGTTAMDTDRLLPAAGGHRTARAVLVGLTLALTLTSSLLSSAPVSMSVPSTRRQLLAFEGIRIAEVPVETVELIGAVCAWISASLYILSRLPQLFKNFMNKSCEGLSMWLFIFAVCGNLTFSGQVFLCNTSAEYLLKTLPFICGSLGTLVFDLTIFVQFVIYQSNAGHHVTHEWSING